MTVRQTWHQPVLLKEVTEGLNLQPGGVYMDLTFGRGGHTQAMLSNLDETGRVIALDRDPDAVRFGQEQFSEEARLNIVHNSFENLTEVAEAHNVLGKVNGILLDLGVSSPQLDQAARGFSFSKEGPLDMRMDSSQGLNVAEWLATANESKIVWVLREFGEERFARRIAAAIVLERDREPITTTQHLAELITTAVPIRERHKHPATRSFQALRIFINRELDQLRDCLPQCLEVLGVGGRLVVISFHSLEDRIVKRFVQEHSRAAQLPREVMVKRSEEETPRLRRLGRAIRACAAEIRNNLRARSAVLRVAEKVV